MLHAILDYQRQNSLPPRSTHSIIWYFPKTGELAHHVSQSCVEIFTFSRLFGARRHPPSFSHLLDFLE